MISDETALTISDQALAVSEQRPLDRHPAAVYLARLKSARSRRVMENALRTIAGMLTGDDPRRVDILAVQWEALRYPHTSAVRSRLAADYSPASVNRMLSALRGVIRECWRLSYIDAETRERTIDFKNVKGETIPAGRDLDTGEILALVENCRGDENEAAGMRDAAMIGLLYTCGLRRAEVVSVDMADIDLDTGAVKVLHGKGSKQRMVYATNGALEALRAWVEIRGGEPGALFVPINKGGRVLRRRGDDGKLAGMTSQAVYDMLKRRAERAGVKDFSPHDFRRTFAGDMLDRGVDIVTVQKIMGHASVTTTGRYDRRPEEAKRQAAAKLHYPFKRRKRS